MMYIIDEWGGNAWVQLAARLCHEANRAIQLNTGDPTPSPGWDEAPQWQKDSAIEGVIHAMNGASPMELHDEWRKFKYADGWVYGPIKDAEAKTHPCLVPYEELGPDQKLKDEVFRAIVKTLRDEVLLG